MFVKPLVSGHSKRTTTLRVRSRFWVRLVILNLGTVRRLKCKESWT